MPFIKQERREMALRDQLPDTQVGDKCYRFYKPMVDEFKKEPRWTTIHKIYKDHRYALHFSHTGGIWCDDCVARDLAWQVFFTLYVMPYELEKRKENGDI